MPPIRKTRRKRPPEGWDLIEPTIDEFQEKLREGKFQQLHMGNSFQATSLSNLIMKLYIVTAVFSILYTQLKMNLMKEKENQKPFGPFSRFTINRADIFSIYITKEEQFPRSCMNFVLKKDMLIKI